MVARTRMLAGLLAMLMWLLPGAGRAYPIAPRTLWELSQQAEVVVLARVTRTWRADPPEPPAPPGETDEQRMWRETLWLAQPLGRVELEVLETWKGTPGKVLTVINNDDVICPEPARFFEGETVVTFLARDGEDWSVVGLSYGKLRVEEADTEVWRARVKEALALQARPSVSDKERRAWSVRAASHEATRWHGLYSLFEEEMMPDSHVNRTRTPTRPHGLTPEEQRRIAAGFIARPGLGKDLAPVLLALSGHPNADVDVTATALLNRWQTGVTGYELVQVQDAMDLLQARLGVKGPGTERCPLEKWDDAHFEQLRACVTERWKHLRPKP